jgi:hypothetical protein
MRVVSFSEYYDFAAGVFVFIAFVEVCFWSDIFLDMSGRRKKHSEQFPLVVYPCGHLILVSEFAHANMQTTYCFQDVKNV